MGVGSCDLRDQGKAYPRTCAVCGLGPCHKVAGVLSQMEAMMPKRVRTYPELIADLQARINELEAEVETLKRERPIAEMYRPIDIHAGDHGC